MFAMLATAVNAQRAFILPAQKPMNANIETQAKNWYLHQRTVT